MIQPLRAVCVFICVLFLVTACASSSKAPVSAGTEPETGLASVPLLTPNEHPFLQVSSSRMTEPASTLDFGALPAVEGWSPQHKYMSLPNQMVLYIQNTGTETIHLAGVKLTGIQTEEAANPFDTCGLEFPGFDVNPGETFQDLICYFPTLQAPSRMQVTYLDGGGRPVIAIPVTGTGRALADFEAPPTGALGDFKIKPFKPQEEVLFKNGTFMKNGIPIGLHDGSTPPAGCTLAITGGGEIPNPRITVVGGAAQNTNNVGINQGVANDEINTGQYVTLAVEIAGGDGVTCVLNSTFWRIGGRFVWDYQEDFRGSIATIQFDAAKTRLNPIQLYWQNTGTHSVKVDVAYTENGVAKQATVQRDLIVETDAGDIDRQMEDFYVWNHRGRVLVDHRNWHWNSGHGPCRSKEVFFTFHKGFIGAANHWRLLFNYPAITAWDPGAVPPPADAATNHNGRNARFNTRQNAKPRYYDLNGQGRNVNIRCPQNAGVKKLKDFASGKHLADEMEFRWHGSVHVNVGGEMGSISTSPKDPVFYKWHKNIDQVYDQYK